VAYKNKLQVQLRSAGSEKHTVSAERQTYYHFGEITYMYFWTRYDVILSLFNFSIVSLVMAALEYKLFSDCKQSRKE